MNIFLFILTILAVLVDIICPMFTPEKDCIKKSAMNLLVNISYSYIIGYVFYLVALLPQRNTNKKMKKVLNNQVKLVISEMNKLFSFIYAESGINQEDQLEKACENVNPQINSQSITLGKEVSGKLVLYNPGNAEYILYLISQIVRQIDEISTLVIFADIEIFTILDKIKKSTFINLEASVLRSISNGVTKNNSLKAFYTGIKELYDLKNELIQKTSK